MIKDVKYYTLQKSHHITQYSVDDTFKAKVWCFGSEGTHLTETPI